MRQPHRSRIAAVIMLVIASIIIVFQLLGLWRPFQIVISGLTRPVATAATSVMRGIGTTFSVLSSLHSLSRENIRLKKELAERDAQLAERKEVEKENELLRQQLNFSKNQPYQLVGATITGYSPDNVRRNFMIDRGSADGVKEGQAVISSGVMVGKVDKVYDRSAVVFLLSDPEFRVQGLSQSGRARGIVRGQLGSGLRFEQVGQNETLETGENILTAGSDVIPKGILIGSVETVDKSDNEIFQAANVRPLIDYGRLEVVFVVKG